MHGCAMSTIMFYLNSNNCSYSNFWFLHLCCLIIGFQIQSSSVCQLKETDGCMSSSVSVSLQAYGVHMNGYVERDGQKFLWVGKRSDMKPTYPNMLDHLVAGGLVWDTILLLLA